MNIAQDEFTKVYDLRHQRLLKPDDYGVYRNHPYLVLPYCAQGSTQKLIGQLSEREIAKVMADIGSALAYLHGLTDFIIHQDIKPDNILMDDDGNYLLADFGISSRFRRKLEKTRSIRQKRSPDYPARGVAHPAYRPPENFAREGRSIENIVPIKSSDIWSFGATLYELAIGEVPFGELGGIAQLQGMDPIQIPPQQLTRNLVRILNSCLAKDPWDRPTAKELSDYADHFMKTGYWKLAETIAPTPLKAKTPKQKRTKFDYKPLLYVTAAAALLLLGFFGYNEFFKKNPDELLAQAEEEILKHNFAAADDLLKEVEPLISERNQETIWEISTIK